MNLPLASDPRWRKVLSTGRHKFQDLAAAMLVTRVRMQLVQHPSERILVQGILDLRSLLSRRAAEPAALADIEALFGARMPPQRPIRHWPALEALVA